MVKETESFLKTFYVNLVGNFLPNSDAEKDFGERVRTYIDGQKWIRRPLTLSPAICSQYGWKCVSEDLLECVTCCAELSVYHPGIEKYDAYKSCIGRILKDLKEKHQKHCPWPLTPSPETFLKMTSMAKEEALYQFIQRLRSCLNFNCSLPRMKESVISDLGLNEMHISSLCKMAEINSVDINQLGRSVVCLAATGWAITSEGMDTKKMYVTCSSCQRSIWLGSYNLLDIDCSHESKVRLANASDVKERNFSSNTENKEIYEPPMKRRSIFFEKIDFDPLQEHRLWCLWICVQQLKDDQSNIPGWRIFVKSLLRNISHPEIPVCSTSKEKLRSIRDLIETWSSSS